VIKGQDVTRGAGESQRDVQGIERPSASLGSAIENGRREWSCQLRHLAAKGGTTAHFAGK